MITGDHTITAGRSPMSAGLGEGVITGTEPRASPTRSCWSVCRGCTSSAGSPEDKLRLARLMQESG